MPSLCSYSEYPYIQGNPELSTRYNDTTTEFFFTCDYMITARDGVAHFVTWLHGNQSVGSVAVNDSGIEELDVENITEFAYNSQV